MQLQPVLKLRIRRLEQVKRDLPAILE